MSVLTSVKVHALASFDPIKESYEGKFSVVLRWYDNRLRKAVKIEIIINVQSFQKQFLNFKFKLVLP